jgi:hypothetical protein
VCFCVCVCLHTRIIKLFQLEFPKVHLIICGRQTPTRKYTVWDFVFHRGEVAAMIKVAEVRHAKYINMERDYVARNVAATSVTPILLCTVTPVLLCIRTAVHCVQSHRQRYRHLFL